MKYKIGQKVRIKTWEKMKEEFGLTEGGGYICCSMNFTLEMEDSLPQDRIMTISDTTGAYSVYSVEGSYRTWSDDMIEGLAKDYKEPEKIESRFEILDIR